MAPYHLTRQTTFRIVNGQTHFYRQRFTEADWLIRDSLAADLHRLMERHDAAPLEPAMPADRVSSYEA